MYKMFEKEKYEEEGYVIIRNFLKTIDITSISKEVNHVFDTWINTNKSNIFENQILNMHSLTNPEYFKNNKEQRIDFFNAITPLKLTDLLENMFGSEIYFHNTQLFFNPLNTKRLPYWHRDMQYSSIADNLQKKEQHNIFSLHIRIPLVKEKGLEIIPKTHQRWDTELERDVRFQLNGHNNNESLPNAKLIDLDVGDILIFNAQMIHRGNYLLNKSRKALDICVGKYHHLSFQFFDKDVLPNEKEFKLITNKQWFAETKKIQMNYNIT